MIPQNYPRIQDENSPYVGCLDDSALVQHTKKIPQSALEELIINSINNASRKSGRELLNIPEDASNEQVEVIYKEEGRQLFKYFRKYCGDPAATAHQINGKNYIDVGTEQFRSRSLQKERMNSGWRYQYLALYCAVNSGRFISVSDIGAAEADFNALIKFLDEKKHPLGLYVSVKNRSNTMGGQDWPKAIRALEEVANNDKNRLGPYCCVFGMAMDSNPRRERRIPRNRKKQPHSINTEIWLSDFFWPFFSNYSYKEIMQYVLAVLSKSEREYKLSSMTDAPRELLEAFGEASREAGLINEDGIFDDPIKLVEFFCD